MFVFAARIGLAGLPSCGDRATALSEPWIRIGLACLEQVIADPSAGELGYGAIAAADGALYAARPFTGEIVRLTDSDGDGLPDTPTIVARGLALPNALTWHAGALYVSGRGAVYRVDDDGAVTTLVDDLPTGEFWAGGIAVWEGRLFVGVGALCDSCPALSDARGLERGGVVSMALDGADQRIEAIGLRSPYALTVHDGGLYVSDSAPDGWMETPLLDEINRLTPGADFGFPACLGAGIALDGAGACQGVTMPVLALPTGSLPVSMASYADDALPLLTGRLLVVLNGSHGRVDLRGYQVVAVDTETWTIADVMPARPDDSPISAFTPIEMSYRGSGFYPRRPIGVAVTPEGWVMLSMGGGRILALRP